MSPAHVPITADRAAGSAHIQTEHIVKKSRLAAASLLALAAVPALSADATGAGGPQMRWGGTGARGPRFAGGMRAG